MADWQVVSGGVTAPKGFMAAGIAAGLKSTGAKDLALILSQTDAIAAGVFTTSQVRAACVDYSRQCLQKKASARAILCNAGQANAATGEPGWEDATICAQLLGQELNIPADAVLLASTGVIGQRIKMEQLQENITPLVRAATENGGADAAQAITTTDLVSKEIALEMTMEGRPDRIGGIAKGSGMIAPNMATMLGFITCDAAVSTSLWHEMLKRATNKSFNQVTVDGDTSTNDCVLALANGQSRTTAITANSPNAQKLEAMLTAVCQYLAKAIARDGEGATCLIEVQVSGAPNDQAASQVAKTIVGSSLVKSAIFGRDPNWGRIAAAAGRAGVKFHQDELNIKLGDLVLMKNGQPQDFDRNAASQYLANAAAGEYLKSDTVLISVGIGVGSGESVARGCDLTYKYVEINAEYTT